jgi:hypothetical protein
MPLGARQAVVMCISPIEYNSIPDRGRGKHKGRNIRDYAMEKLPFLDEKRN